MKEPVRVVLALFKAAKINGIDLALPTQVMLFDDQTEATCGDRNRQREGWLSGNDTPKSGNEQLGRDKEQ